MGSLINSIIGRSPFWQVRFLIGLPFMTKTTKIGLIGLSVFIVLGAIIVFSLKQNAQITNVQFCPRGHHNPQFQALKVRSFTNDVGVLSKERIQEYFCLTCMNGFSVTNILTK